MQAHRRSVRVVPHGVHGPVVDRRDLARSELGALQPRERPRPDRVLGQPPRDDRDRSRGGAVETAVVVQLGALPGEPPQQPRLVVRPRQDPAGPAAALGEARPQREMPGIEGRQRFEAFGGEDGERRIRHGSTAFDVSERRRGGRAGAQQARQHR